MENIENQRAFKLCFDLSRLDYQKFEQIIPPLGSVIFFEGSFYIWLDTDRTINDLKKGLKRLKVGDFYCEPVIFPENSMRDKSFVNNHLTVWYIEHYREQALYDFNKEHQELLKQAHENITKLCEQIKNKEGDAIERERRTD